MPSLLKLPVTFCLYIKYIPYIILLTCTHHLYSLTYHSYANITYTYAYIYKGKSYSMTGNSTAPGIIPRAISEIFSIIETTTTATTTTATTTTATTASNEAYFYVRLSYVELYNNNFRNLLELSNGGNGNNSSGASSSGTSYPMSSARDNYPSTTHTTNTHTTTNTNSTGTGGDPVPTPRSSYTGSSVAKLGDLEDRFNQGLIYVCIVYL